MQVVFDHIISLIIGAVVLLIFVAVQLRGSQSMSETSLHQRVYADALDAGSMLQRDFENMRTAEQTAEAEARGVFTGGAYACTIVAGGDTTYAVTFPTLSDPEGVALLDDPMDAPVQLVTYALVASGDTTTVDLGTSTAPLPLFRLDRTVNGVSTGQTRDQIVHFRVGLADRGSAVFNTASGNCPDDLASIRFELKTAVEGVSHIAGDQRNTSQLNISRYGTTVDLANWE
jgi:hypothetical protein